MISRLESHIQSFLDDTISQTALRDLERALTRSRKARQLFYSYLTLHQELQNYVNASIHSIPTKGKKPQ